MKCYFNQHDMCMRMNLPTIENCRCPLYRSDEPETCAICGQPIEKGIIWFGSNPLCQNCGHLIGACQTCARRNTCVFETDPSPVPKIVQKTIKNGNMVSSFPVKNPERVVATCVNQNCACYRREDGCCRDLGSCSAWKDPTA